MYQKFHLKNEEIKTKKEKKITNKKEEKEKIKITEMYVPTNGELYSSDTACSGDIVILPLMFCS